MVLKVADTGLKLFANHRQQHKLTGIYASVLQKEFEGTRYGTVCIFYLRVRVKRGNGAQPRKNYEARVPIACIIGDSATAQTEIKQADIQDFLDTLKVSILEHFEGKSINGALPSFKGSKYRLSYLSRELDECLLHPLLDHFSHRNVSRTEEGSAMVRKELSKNRERAAAKAIYSLDKGLIEDRTLFDDANVTCAYLSIPPDPNHRPHTVQFIDKKRIRLELVKTKGDGSHRPIAQRSEQ